MKQEADLYKQMEELGPSMVKLMLESPEICVNELINIGVVSIEKSLEAYNIFSFILLNMPNPDTEKLLGIFEKLIKNPGWLNLSDENVHKAWLLLQLFRLKASESLYVSIEKVQNVIFQYYSVALQRGQKISNLNERIKILESENKKYSEICNTFITQVENQIKSPNSKKANKQIFTIKWALDSCFIDDLYWTLKNSKLIHEDTRLEDFIVAFTGMTKSDLKGPINWLGSVRQLAYLMTQLELKAWIEDANSWPSVISDAGIFNYKGKLLNANNLYQVKNQINNHFPKGKDEIDNILDYISHKLRTTLKDFIP